MNCQECRKHLHPFIDSELEVKDNLAILEHVNACAPCRELFAAEERSWTHVRAVLHREVLPAGLRHRLPELLAREDRSRWLRRATVIGVPVGIAAALLIVVAIFHDGGSRKVPELPGGATFTLGHPHGPGIEFAVTRFVAIEDDAAKRQLPVLDADVLSGHSEEFKLIECSELPCFFERLLGPGVTAPRILSHPDSRAASLALTFDGTRIETLVLDLPERHVGVFRLSREAAQMMHLHLLEEDTVTGLRVERCRGCHVVAVTRDPWVYILVSRQGIEPLVALVAETF